MSPSRSSDDCVILVDSAPISEAVEHMLPPLADVQQPRTSGMAKPKALGMVVPVERRSGFATVDAGGADAATLVWRNLCVKGKDSKKQVQVLLEPQTGYVESGNILAILGPSGSGKVRRGTVQL